jgi:hypothetical protein
MKENIMQTSVVSQPILIGDVLWRNNPQEYVAQQTGVSSGAGQSLHSDKVNISNEASVLSELQKATNHGYSGKTADLLTDAEREKFQRISDRYGDQRDREIGELAISLAMDKVMATASKTEVPTLDKEYLQKLINELSGGSQGDTLHSRLDSSFLSDLLSNNNLIS